MHFLQQTMEKLVGVFERHFDPKPSHAFDQPLKSRGLCSLSALGGAEQIAQLSGLSKTTKTVDFLVGMAGRWRST